MELAVVVQTLPLALIADYTNSFSSENKTADWLLKYFIRTQSKRWFKYIN